MSYSHFSTIERGQLEALHRLGWSSRAIGRQLDRHHSSVARELKRNDTMTPSHLPKLNQLTRDDVSARSLLENAQRSWCAVLRKN
jgi:IS30 family transposase